MGQFGTGVAVITTEDESGEKAGMTGLIHKPVQPEELKRILAAIPARTAR